MKKWLIVALILGGIWYMWPSKPVIKNLERPIYRIVAFGDSLTAGYGGNGVSYPAELARLSGKEVINMGLSGETAVHAPERLAEVLSANPDMVLIEFGANDHMRSLSTGAAISAVAQLVDGVQQAGAVAVIVDTGGPGMQQYTEGYKKLAEEKQAIFIPGIITDIFYKRALKSDAVHPNAEGYKRVAAHVYKYLKPYL